jgi:cytochrome c biogenesis protein CcdA
LTWDSLSAIWSSSILIELFDDISQKILILLLSFLTIIHLHTWLVQVVPLNLSILRWLLQLLFILIGPLHRLGLLKSLSTLRLSLVHLLHELQLMDVRGDIRLRSVKLLLLCPSKLNALSFHSLLSLLLLLGYNLVLLLQ